mgnify:CR=1 FL=1
MQALQGINVPSMSKMTALSLLPLGGEISVEVIEHPQSSSASFVLHSRFEMSYTKKSVSRLHKADGSRKAILIDPNSAKKKAIDHINTGGLSG